jgi:RNA polymerase sigma-70 factor (ECF subfamily)
MARQANLDEQTLIGMAKRGDLDAFNFLVLEYQNAVFTVTYRIMGDEMSAADAAQDAFITAYRRLETYRGGNFRAWLLKIATNTCYDALRYYKRRPAAALDDLVGDDYDDGPPIPDPITRRRPQNSELSAAIRTASKPQSRSACRAGDVRYRRLQLSGNRRSANIQVGTVKSRLNRARQRSPVFAGGSGTLRLVSSIEQ